MQSDNRLYDGKIINRQRQLLNLTQTEHVRSIYHDINWNSRLIAIRGAKGVGKTTLMLQYMKMREADAKRMLYASLDSAYFTQHSLLDFAENFYKRGANICFWTRCISMTHGAKR